ELGQVIANQTLDSYTHMLESGTLSDVILCICSTDEGSEEPVLEKEIKAHKLILASRSPVFAAMFEHELEESKQNRVVITDIKPEVAESMVRYIYAGKVDSFELYAMELLEAADKVTEILNFDLTDL